MSGSLAWLGSEAEGVWRLVTAPLRPLPAFVLAGAPKCGTSTFFDYLTAHPGVRRGKRKEPTSFLHYPGSRVRAAANFPMGFGRSFIVGDGSVEVFAHPDGPASVARVVPDARLIFMFRDPVKRTWSDYQMFRKDGREKMDFGVRVRNAMRWVADSELDELVASASRSAFNPVRYISAGLYARHVARWLEVFSKEQCLFLVSEEFFADPEGLVQRAFEHLGLPQAEISRLPVARDGGYSEVMDAMVERELREFFAAENAKLAGLLGRDLPWE